MQNVSLGSREPDACKYRYLSSDRFKGAFTAAKSEIIKEGSDFFGYSLFTTIVLVKFDFPELENLKIISGVISAESEF